MRIPTVRLHTFVLRAWHKIYMWPNYSRRKKLFVSTNPTAPLSLRRPLMFLSCSSTIVEQHDFRYISACFTSWPSHFKFAFICCDNWPIDSPPKMASWRTSFVGPSIVFTCQSRLCKSLSTSPSPIIGQ